MTSYSFEFFPPRTARSCATFYPEVEQLLEDVTHAPSFMSITYGAGGTSGDWTYQTINTLMQRTTVPVASHLTYMNAVAGKGRGVAMNMAEQLWQAGVHRLIALRGDIPTDSTLPAVAKHGEFSDTAAFIAALKAQHPFHISVGCYPEKHPDASCLEEDIRHLKQKFEAGAEQAITQFFFDNALYYDFLDKTAKAGITHPIYPGLVPIHDIKTINRFATTCGASVPSWILDRFDKLALDRLEGREEARKIAIDIVTHQVSDLCANGVEHIHFYTLNKAAITQEACRQIQRVQ